MTVGCCFDRLLNNIFYCEQKSLQWQAEILDDYTKLRAG